MDTIHVIARRWYRPTTLADWLADHPRCPQWIAERIVPGINRHARRRAAHSGVYAEETRPTRDSYARRQAQHRLYTAISVVVRHDMPYRGAVLAAIIRAMDSPRAAALNALPPCSIEPVPWVRHPTYGTADEERAHVDRMRRLHMPSLSDSGHRWYTYWRWHVERVLAEQSAAAQWSRCLADPDYRISGYLAESILEWRQGKQGYIGCNGCDSYADHYAHPERWETLLAHAPTGAIGDGWEQVYPHEHARAERLRAAGWRETLRVNDSLFTAP